MRTETDLGELFAELAARAPDPVAVEARLLTARRPPRGPASRRPPRPLVLVAVVACLVLVAVLVPSLLRQRTAEPADRRTPGYWGFVSEVVAPTGWDVDSRGIAGDREYTVLRPSADPDQPCEVYVYGRGAYTPPARPGIPVTIGDRPGTYLDTSDTDPSQLVWTYADDAWASVTCFGDPRTDHQRWSEDLARGVRFTPSEARLPYRLTALPDGYTVGALVLATIDGLPTAAVSLRSTGGPTISVFTTPTAFAAPGPGLPGVEQLDVGGHPTAVREDQRGVQLSVGGRFATVSSAPGADATQSWLPGERDALLEVAAGLRFADDLADPSTWYDARRALP